MKLRFTPAAAVAAACLYVLPAAGAAVYDIDAALSTLTVSGSFAGIPAGAQQPNSDIAFLDGILLADIDAGSISFAGGSTIDALPFASDLSPAAGGADGSAPADFGLYGGNAISYANAAGRDFTFDVSGAATLENGSYASSGLTLTIVTGTVDYRVVVGSAFPGTRSLANGTANNGAGAGTVTIVNGIETIAIPLSGTYSFSQAGIDADVAFTGQIIATRAIPEPTSVALLGAAGLGLIGRRRR